ncbi:MAG: transglutaminase domain-containing protein [Oscillospiraceae bacterium]|nr:transglutaminase domain-containing protein [Oscillospiraceae bacterium]
MRQRIGRHILGAVLAILILTALCGCGVGAGAAPDPTPAATSTVTPESTPMLNPEEDTAQQERQARLAAQKDGFLLDKGYLYAVDETGELRSNTYVGVLYFREDGRYTSGSEDLDRMVAGAIRKSTDEKMTRMDMLRAMYEYTRDHIKYVGFGNHEDSYRAAHGKDGWMVESATYALENGTGNCYHFAATFAALARGVGFQAYAASGLIGSEDQEHGWVEIVDDTGEVWYSDPETEYARSYWMKQEFDLFYKSKDEIGSVTGIGYLELTDPFEAERKEAEAEGRPLPSPAPKT